MNVNFNNLRKQAIYSYHRLCIKLNEGLNSGGQVIVEAEDIEKEMYDLRQQLWGICCTYQEGNETFKDLTEEIDASGKIAVFNPEND